MKVLIVTHENFPFGGPSANFVRYFALALIHQEIFFKVILPNGNNQYGITSSKSSDSEINGIDYKHLFNTEHPKSKLAKIFNFSISFLLTIKYLFKHTKEYDTIVVYNIHSSRVIPSLLASKLLSKKILVILPEYYDKSTLSKFQFLDFNFGMKFLSRYFDGFIVLTNFLNDYLKKTLKIQKATLVIPNLMDPNFFNLKDIKPYINKKITIGYAGTPTKKDGVFDLLHSFALLIKEISNVHLLIIGDSYTGKSPLPELKKLAEDLNISNNVTFLGLIPFQDIPKYFHACQILALTRPKGVSSEAGFPTKLGEYFACHKPVLMSGVGDIPLYFNNKQELVITKPGDLNEISEGFKYILSNHIASKTMADNAFGWMNSNLNYRNVAKKIKEFIEVIR